MDGSHVKRFVREVFAFEPINSLLRSGARLAFPGKPARGGEYTNDQRTWARTLIQRKLWKEVPLEDVPLFSEDCACPDLSYLIPHVTSLLEAAGLSCEALETQPQRVPKARAAEKEPQPVEVPSSSSARKPRTYTATEWSKSCLKQKVQKISNEVTSACSSKEDASFLCEKVLRRVDASFPGFSRDVPSLSQECHCGPLVQELAKLREAWKNERYPIVRALDKALHDAGFGAEQMAATGYIASVTTAKKAIRRSAQNWRMRNTGGRPSKVKDPKWQALVQEALDLYSTSSSLTCLGPNKERRRVRSLSAYASTILRTDTHDTFSENTIYNVHSTFSQDFMMFRLQIPLWCNYFPSFLSPSLSGVLQHFTTSLTSDSSV